MSNTVDQSFVRQYERDVHHVFQTEGGFLRGTVRLKTNIVGSSTTFQKIGTGTAVTKARHGKVPLMNVDHTPIECTLSDRYAAEMVDKLDELKLNIDERDAVTKAGAWACGRAIDQDLFTAMDGTTQSALTWSIASDAATLNSLLGIQKAFNAAKVPNDGQRYCTLTANAWAAAERVEQFSSADFVDARGRPFVDGAPFPMFRRWAGILWTNHEELPNAGEASGCKGFAWHKTAVGYGMGADITADIDWEGDAQAHRITHCFSGGAALIDDTGVFEINIGDDTTALPTS